MARPFFTIEHSTRSIDEFIDLLSKAEVRLVVDVRTIPRSRTNRQYNSEALDEALSVSRIYYEHIAALGGLRGRKRDVPEDVNAFWQNQRFHNYADYALSEGRCSEVLNVISRSPSELRPVLDAILQTAGRLCEAEYAHFFKLQDGKYHLAGSNNAEAEYVKYLSKHPIGLDRGSLVDTDIEWPPATISSNRFSRASRASARFRSSISVSSTYQRATRPWASLRGRPRT
jgi:hypothetical protein